MAQWIHKIKAMTQMTQYNLNISNKKKWLWTIEVVIEGKTMIKWNQLNINDHSIVQVVISHFLKAKYHPKNYSMKLSTFKRARTNAANSLSEK